MSSPITSEHFADIRDGAPRLVAMPVLNGLEATRLIKAADATRESRVIAYTGNDSIPPPLERWFVAIVSKPSPPDVVLAAVQHAVSQ
jgi:CheY-like chemotaxis protein